MKYNSILLCVLLALTANLFTTAKAQVNITDSLALVDLYHSTNGPHWRNHTNWLTAAPVGAWYGITIDNNRVTEIKLQFNFLSGPLPASIGNLTGLHTLDLFSNGLSGSIPFSIGNLVNLEYLDLTSDGTDSLTGSIPSSIGNLVFLSFLELQNNRLGGRIPTSITNLVNLSTMDLHGNAFSGSIPDFIGNMSSLAFLNLSYNSFSGSIPFSFGNLTNIGDIELVANQLSGAIPSSLGNLKYLYTLNLSQNQLTGSIPRSLSNAVSLRELILNNNLLTEDKNVHFHIPVQPYTLVDLTYNSFSFNELEFVAKKFPQSYYDNQATITIHQHGSTLSVNAGGTLRNNTYQWFKAGTTETVSITGDSTFMPPTSGRYYAKVTNAIATQLTLYTDTINFTMSSLAANTRVVAESNNTHFSIYPNPATNTIHIQTTGTITLTNSDGKVLLTKTIHNNEVLNVSKYANGVYYLKNTTTGEVQKIVVAH